VGEASSGQRVFTTLALLKAKVKTMKQANVEVDNARVSQALRSTSSVKAKSNALVQLIHHGQSLLTTLFCADLLILSLIF
jgi:hypothetical protein